MAVAHKGSISMGMVLIPIGLYKTTVDNDIHFNQLEKESKARIKYKKYCSHCGKEVAAKDIIKGYEYEKDKYVVMTDDELKRIKTKKDKTIHILQFAKMSEVNMIYYEKDYYAIPETGAEKAYELLRQALLAENLEENRVILRNKRNMELLPRFPELSEIHKSANKRCVLDGELVVMVNGVPDFYELQKRTLLTSRTRIELGANRLPASFVAYDCLQVENRVLLDTPLLERKEILQNLIEENERIAVSRYIPEKGTQLFALTVEKELEGVVAKKASSLYYQGKRTKDWIKFKRMADKDFIICGYEYNSGSGKMVSLILGEYQDGELVYAGTVSWGVRRDVLRVLTKGVCPFRESIELDGNIVWCKPEKTCIVEYMPNTQDALRQPVFKGIRDDA